MRSTELPVDPVMVKELAFADPVAQFQHLHLAVAVDLEGAARLDARQYADQAVGNPVLAGDLPGIVVLANAGRIEVVHRPGRGFGALQRGLDEPICHGLGVVAEILQQYAHPREIPGHSFREGKQPQRAAKNQPVPSAQHPDDMIRVFWYKSIHGVPLLWANVFATHIYLITGGAPFFYPLVAAMPR
jgi:hypothetical protein